MGTQSCSSKLLPFTDNLKTQGAIDQLLAVETLDAIVDILANGDFCASMGDDRCPAIVDVIIRQGLPMLTAAGADGDFSQVFYFFKVFICIINSLLLL